MEQKQPTMQDYLLDAIEDENSSFFRTPVRDKVKVTPLIDGKETYEVMEESIVQAKKSVYIAFWVFFPSTPLQSLAVRSLFWNKGETKNPLRTWGDLLQYIVAQKGIDLRIILTDFDPVFGSHHPDTWSTYCQLCRIAEHLEHGREHFQVICSRHPAKIASGVEKEVRTGLLGKIMRLNKREITFSNRPGLWKSIQYNPKRKPWFTLAKQPELVVYPVSHHQKLCIIDGEIAFCGGLDVSKGRIDTPSHTSDVRWHDIDCMVEGAPAGDIQRNFISRWNLELQFFQDFLRSANAVGQPHFKLPTLDVSIIDDKDCEITKMLGNSFVQIHRTISIDNPFFPIPVNKRCDIEDVYKKAISHANHYIYIENQYIRSVDLAKWLIARQKEVPDLQVIIVIPVAPEELKMKKVDPITAHGIALQYETLMLLQKAFWNESKRDTINLGLYSMIARSRATKQRVTNSCNSYQIYVHSKILIVDDIFASIGSANATPRSFQADTELAVGWFDPEYIREFRIKLWEEMLGCDKKTIERWDSKSFVGEWEKNARHNCKSVPRKRRGFIVPHNLKNFKIYPGKKGNFPNIFAEWIDLDPEDDDDALA